MFLKVMLASLQVALNLDLAGVESFVRERLGKEVKFWLNGWFESFVLLEVMKFNPTTQTQNIFYLSIFHLIMLN
jgi:hypothetical protein